MKIFAQILSGTIGGTFSALVVNLITYKTQIVLWKFTLPAMVFGSIVGILIANKVRRKWILIIANFVLLLSISLMAVYFFYDGFPPLFTENFPFDNELQPIALWSIPLAFVFTASGAGFISSIIISILLKCKNLLFKKFKKN